MPGRFASWLITINFTHQLNSGRNLVRRNKNRKVLFMAHIFYTACCRPSRIGSENCEFPASFFANFAFLFLLSLTSTFGIGNNKKNYERRSFRTDSVLFLHFVVRKKSSLPKDTLTTKAQHTHRINAIFIFTLHFIPTALPRPHRLASRKNLWAGMISARLRVSAKPASASKEAKETKKIT